MYIAVLSAKRKWSKKEYFDQLNNFYLKHRETINKDKTALMSWRAVENNGHWTINKNSATDGDLFIAQALLLASKQWHDDKYQKEAHAILQDILRYEYNPDTETLTVGDWADSKSKYYNLMRTSDVMPEFFDNFYQETGDIYLVADVLGHKDVNTTKKHYAQMDDARRKYAASIVKLREEQEHMFDISLDICYNEINYIRLRDIYGTNIISQTTTNP